VARISTVVAPHAIAAAMHIASPISSRDDGRRSASAKATTRPANAAARPISFGRVIRSPGT
jgi:hypothetical protein